MLYRKEKLKVLADILRENRFDGFTINSSKNDNVLIQIADSHVVYGVDSRIDNSKKGVSTSLLNNALA